MRETRSIEFSPLALSVWGKRVMWMRSTYDLSYPAIAKEVGMDLWAIRKMVNDPAYEPSFSRGQRFIRYYKRLLRQYYASHSRD